MLSNIKNYFYNLIYNIDGYETKLSKYSAYKLKEVYNWKKQTNLNWKTVIKILKELKIFNEQNIRSGFREVVQNNQELFYADNTYIIAFGPTGKSGDKMIYEFRKANPDLENKIIEKYEIVNKVKANLIFLDDIIGTGRQATTYIWGSIKQMITSSNKCFLVTICSTYQGIFEVNEAGFGVLSANILKENESYYLSESCNVFTQDEKSKLDELNYKLIDRKNIYHLGLLVAFNYSTPDNTMPIIWKDVENTWKPLLPREF